MRCDNCHAKVPDNISQCPYCDCGFTFQKQIDRTDKYGNKIQLLRIEREKLLKLKKENFNPKILPTEEYFVETKKPINWMINLSFFIIACGMPLLSLALYNAYPDSPLYLISVLLCVIALILVGIKKDTLFTKTVKIPVQTNYQNATNSFEIKDGYFYTKDVIGFYDDNDITGERTWIEINKKDCKTIIKDSFVHGYKIYIDDVDNNTDILEALYFPDIFDDSEIIKLIDSLMPIKFINFDDYN